MMIGLLHKGNTLFVSDQGFVLATFLYPFLQYIFSSQVSYQLDMTYMHNN